MKITDRLTKLEIDMKWLKKVLIYVAAMTTVGVIPVVSGAF